MKNNRKISPIHVLCMVSMLALGSCKITTESDNGIPLYDSLNGMQSQTEHHMLASADEAMESGHYEDAVVMYEKLYMSHGTDDDIALRFAQALRKTGHQNRALMVLSPYIYGHDKKTRENNRNAGNYSGPPAMMAEYAACQVELGRYDKAMSVSETLLNDDSAFAWHPVAYNIRGIALDSTGRHSSAEDSYRMALDSWGDNPTPVMNNLALSLTYQGHFDEALSTLRQALVIDPERTELARNIEIITEIRDSVIAKPAGVK